MTLKIPFLLLGRARLTHLEHEICPIRLSRNYCWSVFYAIHIRKSSSGEELLALWKSLPMSEEEEWGRRGVGKRRGGGDEG